MKHHLHVARGFKFEAVCLADQSRLFCLRSETQNGAVVHRAEVPSAEVFLMGALQREAGSSSAGAPTKNLRSFDPNLEGFPGPGGKHVENHFAKQHIWVSW